MVYRVYASTLLAGHTRHPCQRSFLTRNIAGVTILDLLYPKVFPWIHCLPFFGKNGIN